MEKIIWIASEKIGVDASHCEPDGQERRDGHVKGLTERRRIQHRRNRIDVCHFTINNRKSGRCVHPGIRGDDEDTR